MAERHVLVVEDDGIIAARLEDTLRSWGFTTEAAPSGEEAVAMAAARPPDLILMDVHLAGEIDGVEAAAQIRERGDTPVIYLTAYSDESLLDQAKVTEPHGYLVKPVRDKELRATVEMALYRHGMERRLRESEARYHAVVVQAIEGIFLFDIETRKLLEANPAFLKMLGYTEPEIREISLYDIVDDDRTGIDGNIREVIRRNRHAVGERRYRTRDGSLVDVEVNGTVIRYGGRQAICVMVHDITRRKRMEAREREMAAHIQYIQKMESLGIMAGAVAHNFNNLLSVILGHAEMAQMDLPPDSPVQFSVGEVLKAGMRAREIIKQILVYRGKFAAKPGPVALSGLVQEMMPMLEISISKSVILRCELEENLPPVTVDNDRIRQVIVSLVTNAVEAIGDDNGDITIRTGVVHADRRFLDEPFLEEDLPEGQYVHFTVADTGCGMDPATRSKIFDPFFTTKLLGRGLGLSAVLGIVRQYRGAIKVSSSPGSGSSFQVLLPSSVE